MEMPVLEEQVAAARRLGARGCEMLLTVRDGVDITVAGGKLVARTPTALRELRVTTWLDGGCRGVAVGAPNDVVGLVERALKKAEKAQEDPLSGPVDRLRPVVGGLGIEDRRYKQLTDEDRVDVLLTAQRSVASESKALKCRDFTYQDQSALRRFANSRGVSLEEHSTRYDVRGSLSVGELTLTDEMASRTFASIASLPFGTTMARRASALLQDGESLDGSVHAMLPPVVVAALFAHVAEAFVGERFDGTLPFFLAPKGDEPVVDSRIHLLDDGRIPGGLRTRSFDDRGVVPVPLTLLREGVPDGFLRTPEVARATHTTPTGHWVDGALRAGNLMLRGGTRSMNATFTDHGEWSLKIDAIDFGALDFATGVLHTELDGQVMHSNVQKGAVRRRAATIDVGALLNSVIEVCSDTDRVGHVDAPALFVNGLILG